MKVRRAGARLSRGPSIGRLDGNIAFLVLMGLELDVQGWGESLPQIRPRSFLSPLAGPIVTRLSQRQRPLLASGWPAVMTASKFWRSWWRGPPGRRLAHPPDAGKAPGRDGRASARARHPRQFASCWPILPSKVGTRATPSPVWPRLPAARPLWPGTSRAGPIDT
jgi:hypothetical protein